MALCRNGRVGPGTRLPVGTRNTRVNGSLDDRKICQALVDRHRFDRRNIDKRRRANLDPSRSVAAIGSHIVERFAGRNRPEIFANHPLVVRVGGTNFVRSIQKANEDGSLTFYCAIDEGIVLARAQGCDLSENLARIPRQP